LVVVELVQLLSLEVLQEVIRLLLVRRLLKILLVLEPIHLRHMVVAVAGHLFLVGLPVGHQLLTEQVVVLVVVEVDKILLLLMVLEELEIHHRHPHHKDLMAEMECL
jgi:hypothetical protein